MVAIFEICARLVQLTCPLVDGRKVVLRMRVKDVDLQAGLTHIRAGKGGKERATLLPDYMQSRWCQIFAGGYAAPAGSRPSAGFVPLPQEVEIRRMCALGRKRTRGSAPPNPFFVRGYRSRGHSWIKFRCSPGSRTMRFFSFSRSRPSILR